jgi:hypothetical protein
MAQTNFTPISLYYSTTAAAAPTAGNLVAGELAINTADGKLFYKDSSGVVQTLATKNTAAGSFTSLTDSGNLTFTGTGNRILGDFSNATAASRVLFQTSTTNSNTNIGAIPNGTATRSNLVLYNNADPANAAFLQLQLQDSTSANIISSSIGTGTFVPLVIQTGGSERLRIDTSGNVLIGQTASIYNQAGRGVLELNGSSQAVFGLNTGGVAGSRLLVDGSNLYINNTKNGFMSFENNGTERMRIDSSGNVGIGSTGKPGTRLNVVSASATVSAGDFYVNAASSTAIPALTLSKYDNNNTTSQVFVQFAINQYAGGSGQINANGSSAAAFGSFSDIRLKENIEPLPAQLGNILALKPCEFDYKTGGHQIGFIAQEMQEVYPDVVGEGADGMLMITGWSKTEARLVKAIQEQQAMIKTLTTRLNALEGK